MHPLEAPSVSIARRGDTRLDSDPTSTVVWVRGEHDIATRVNLSVTIARAAGRDDADIVVDLSGVTFMDASTVGALFVARVRLHARSRSLSVRDPSPRAQRVLDLCGLAQLIDGHPAAAPPQRTCALGTTTLAPTALGSWVDVPAGKRHPGSARPHVVPEPLVKEPVRVAARRRGEPAGSAQQRRAPS